MSSYNLVMWLGVAFQPLWPLGHRSVGLCDFACAEILFPIGAAGLDQSARFGQRGEGGKGDRAIRLLAIARAAQTHEVVNTHCAAFAFCDNVATLIRVPRPARGAAIKAGEHGGFDGGGDGGFLGHDSRPCVGYPYFICQGRRACNRKDRSRFVHGLFTVCCVHALFTVCSLLLDLEDSACESFGVMR